MEACSEAGRSGSGEPGRKRRYRRAPVDGPLALAGPKAELLGYVAAYAPVTLPQLALLVGLSPKATRRHLRALFDAGLVDLLAVPRESLAPTPGLGGGPALGGSAPNLYRPAPAGMRVLRDAGLGPEAPSTRSRLEARGGYFLAHALAVNDVRIWLERCARRYPGHSVERWRAGEDAVVALPPGASSRAARPDAWFAYRIGGRVLAAAVEVDRGTERGDRRWKEKVEAYSALFAAGLQREASGYENARVLVTTPDTRRRDGLAERIARLAPPALAAKAWVGAHGALAEADLGVAGWRRPGQQGLHPLVPTGLLGLD